MADFLLRRAAAAAGTMLGVLVVTFVLFRLVPGDFAQAVGGELATPGTLADIRRVHGLDRPLFVNLDGDGGGLLDSQLGHHVAAALTLDFGRSWSTRRPVMERLAAGAGPSAALGLPIFLGQAVAGLGLGAFAARRRGRRADRAVVLASVVAVNLPVPVTILGAQTLLAHRLGWFPMRGLDGPGSLVLPVAIGVLASLGGSVRFHRTVFVDGLDREHVRFAKALGTPPGRLFRRHVVRTALAQVLARLAWGLPSVFLGTLLLEQAFDVPGIGGVMLEAIAARDYPVVNALTFLGSAAVVLGGLLADLASAWADPRVRFGGER